MNDAPDSDSPKASEAPPLVDSKPEPEPKPDEDLNVPKFLLTLNSQPLSEADDVNKDSE